SISLKTAFKLSSTGSYSSRLYCDFNRCSASLTRFFKTIASLALSGRVRCVFKIILKQGPSLFSRSLFNNAIIYIVFYCFVKNLSLYVFKRERQPKVHKNAVRLIILKMDDNRPKYHSTFAGGGHPL